MEISSGVRPTASSPRALFVDDDADTRDVYSSVAPVLGWHVYVVSEGPEAVLMATIVRPHVVVLDIRMPQVDGFETLRRLRANRTTQEIPVVLVSASAPRVWADRLARCGCEAFLQKPYDLDTLDRTLRALLPASGELREYRRSG